jgi:RNA polymerase sigma-70 factor (ECF subfamily)
MPALHKADRSERAAAKGLRKRDPEALKTIYERHGSVTFGYLLRALGDRGAAEDVQQRVFTEVWERGPSYDPARAGLLTWIMQITRSRAIDRLRKRVPVPADPEAAERQAGADPDLALDALEEQWRMSELLRRLPGEEADLLRMRFYDDLSQTEIASATGVPLGTVKMRMVQGLERLRGLIDEEGW